MSIDPVNRDAFILGIIWLSYFSVHSLLASLMIKHWVSSHWPEFMPAYRLTYNITAIILLAAPVWLLHNGHSIIFWQFTGVMKWLTNGLALAAIIGFVYSLRYYDGQEVMGIRQIKQHETRVEDQENLHFSPFHYYVRHPWYCFALIIIWSRDMNSLMLVTALLMTLYFIIGSRLEERKLKYYYGDVYRQYCKAVPGLIPLPWKHINKEQAESLINDYQTKKSC